MYRDDSPNDIDQGAIVETSLFDAVYAESAGLILTPRCDIDMDKADFLTLCVVATPDAILGARPEWSTRKRRHGELSKIIDQSHPRWQWLEPLPGFDSGAIVDFQVILSIATAELEGAQVAATLDGPWREQVNSRYAAYMGRVGVPDVSRHERNQRRDAVLNGYDPRVLPSTSAGSTK